MIIIKCVVKPYPNAKENKEKFMSRTTKVHAIILIMFSKLPEDRYGGPLHVGGTGTPLKVASKPSQPNSSKKIFCCLQICVVWSGYTGEFSQVMKNFDKKAEPCKLNEIKGQYL